MKSGAYISLSPPTRSYAAVSVKAETSPIWNPWGPHPRFRFMLQCVPGGVVISIFNQVTVFNHYFTIFLLLLATHIFNLQAFCHNWPFLSKQQKHVAFLRGRQIYIMDSLSFCVCFECYEYEIYPSFRFALKIYAVCLLLASQDLLRFWPSTCRANVVFLVTCYQSVQSDPKMFNSTHAQSAIKDPDLRASSSGSANLLFVPQDNQADASLCHFFGRKKWQWRSSEDL